MLLLEEGESSLNWDQKWERWKAKGWLVKQGKIGLVMNVWWNVKFYWVVCWVKQRLGEGGAGKPFLVRGAAQTPGWSRLTRCSFSSSTTSAAPPALSALNIHNEWSYKLILFKCCVLLWGKKCLIYLCELLHSSGAAGPLLTHLSFLHPGGFLWSKDSDSCHLLFSFHLLW